MDLTICIIDDDLVSQFATQYSIEQANTPCKVITCDSGEAGMEMFQKCINNGEDLPDVLLLDLIMKGMSGWDFIEEIKIFGDAIKNLDIYILSAFANSKDRERAKKHSQIKGYFDKPISKEHFLKVLCKERSNKRLGSKLEE